MFALFQSEFRAKAWAWVSGFDTTLKNLDKIWISPMLEWAFVCDAA